MNHSASEESAISTKGLWSYPSYMWAKERDSPAARGTTYMQWGRSDLPRLPSDSTGRSSGWWSIYFTDTKTVTATLPIISPSGSKKTRPTHLLAMSGYFNAHIDGFDCLRQRSDVAAKRNSNTCDPESHFAPFMFVQKMLMKFLRISAFFSIALLMHHIYT